HVVERPLAWPDDLACQGYLVWNREPVRDVFLVVNGSGIGSNAFLHPSFKDTITTSPIAYATFDKPGIRAPFDDPAAVRRDDAILARYTLGHGITCATAALRARALRARGAAAPARALRGIPHRALRLRRPPRRRSRPCRSDPDPGAE